LGILEGGIRLFSGMHQHLIRLEASSLDLGQLASYGLQGASPVPDTAEPDERQKYTNPKGNFVVTILGRGRDDPYIGLNLILMFGLESWSVVVLLNNRRSRRGWLLAFGSLLCLVRLGVSLHREDEERQREYHHFLQHNAEIVPQKLLTRYNCWGTLNTAGENMANVLNTDKQIAIIAALSEGSSIRSIERMTGVHRDTIMRLGVKVGQGCTALMDSTMRDLPCTRLEMDEIWGFIGKKEKHLKPEDDFSIGSVWTFCAIDADTKLVPAFRVGKRDTATADAFVADVASRMRTRVQISTDGLRAYVEAIEKSFGGDADYAQIIKTYGSETSSDNRRYSQPEFVSSEKKVICGSPNFDLISTSYIERLNATTRLHMRRLTRLTLAFSKKRENFEAAVGLHFAYYNFVKRHNTLRCTPSMAAGITGSFWGVGELLEAAA
jgi:IS1 family transposase